MTDKPEALPSTGHEALGPETLRKLKRKHRINENRRYCTCGAEPLNTYVDAHAAAWEAKEEQFRRVGNALVEAGFTPLGDDYAASVEAMSRSYENSKDDGEADRRRLEALSDPGLLSWARAIIRAWNRADGKEQQRMYASMKVAEKLLAALATETT